jgi:hypothetical protein
MAKEPTNLAADRKERADIARHQLLSIAIPFPENLDWSTPEKTEESLNALYGFGNDLATSVIDWYLQRRRGKKRQSVYLRYASYAFAIAGVAVPLIKIFNLSSLEHIFGRYADDVSNIAVEAALVLLAIAGGLHAIDGLIGASSAWMRYVAAAIGLTDQLVRFRFDWNTIAGEPQFIASATASNASDNLPVPPSPPVSAPDGGPVTRTLQGRKYELVQGFCLKVIEVVRDETAIWSTEVRENVEKFEKDLKSAPFRAPGR